METHRSGGASSAAIDVADPVTDDGPQPGAGTIRPWPNPAVRARSARLAGTTRARALGCAALFGALLHLRYGYGAGHADHFVLSAVGLHWADPDAFRGDWVLANAPQPHWLFDIVTWFGAATGTLDAVYLAYWLISLAVFGTATALLAPVWAAARPWFAIIAVTVLVVITPQWLLGTGTPVLAIALPGVLGGFLVYLCAVSLLLARHRLAAGTAVVAALVHVQIGAIVAVLLLATVAVRLVRAGRFERLLLGASLACAAIVIGALRARPVAGSGEFVDACARLIPFHCDANSWTRTAVIGGAALVALGLLTVLYRPELARWAVVLLLPAIGILGGVAADRWDWPVLGRLAQGLNVYRLDVVLLPFAAWGMLSPVFGRLPARLRWAALAVTLVLGGLAVNQGGWAVSGGLGPWFLLITGAGLVLLCGAVAVPRWAPRAATITRIGSAALVLGILSGGVVAGTLRFRAVNPAFIARPEIRAWGAAVAERVPPGEQILAAPLALYVRLATRRGVVVDCKNGPYGGPAWRDYSRRLNSLGGFDQCLEADPEPFNRLPPHHIAAVAERYRAEYLVLERRQRWWLHELRRRGWTVALEPQPEVDNYLLRAPWAR